METKSYIVAIKTKPGMVWERNELRFFTRSDAEQYGNDLKTRWKRVVECVIQESSEPPNTHYPVPNQQYRVTRISAPTKKVKL